MKINREIEDLHGHKFALVDPQFSTISPNKELPENTNWIFNKDILTGQTFILVKERVPKPRYWYIFWENNIYVYGLLSLISYNPDKDIRYEKEKR